MCHPGLLIECCSQLLAAAEEAAQDGDNLSLDDMPEIDEESNLPRSAAYSVFSAASLLRHELSMENSIPFPPSPEDLSEEKIYIPIALFNFFYAECSYDEMNLEKRVHIPPSNLLRKVLSIGQDLAYCVNNGRLKAPKHISLPMAVKQITGSTKVVTLLNRFGHGISESELAEYESAMAEQHFSIITS